MGQPIDAVKTVVVKSAYLLNFIKLTEWPEEVFEDAHSPIVVGVVGHDPVGQSLQKTLGQAKIRGRPIVIRDIPTQLAQEHPPENDPPVDPVAQALDGCHLVYLCESEAVRIEPWVSAARGSYTVTVGSRKRFAEAGAMLAFDLANDKVVFYVNPQAIKDSRSKVSSKLVGLARIVEPRHNQQTEASP